VNEPLDHLGEPAPRLPDEPYVSERHRETRIRDLAADLVIGAVLGAVLYCAAILVSWWIA
jgi:hypothetical protein